MTAELATINVTSAAPSTTASFRQHFQQHADAGPASSSIIGLTHDPASIDHTNILEILSAADWLDNQEEKLRQDNKNNSFGRHAQFLSDDERRSASMAVDGRQDLPRYMMDRVWAVCNDAEKAEAMIASLLKLDSFVEQERFLSEIAVKEAENDSGTNTEAAADEEPQEPGLGRPSVSPFFNHIHANGETVANVLQEQVNQQTDTPRTMHNQPSFINLFILFSSALAAIKKTAPSAPTGLSRTMKVSRMVVREEEQEPAKPATTSAARTSATYPAPTKAAPQPHVTIQPEIPALGSKQYQFHFKHHPKDHRVLAIKDVKTVVSVSWLFVGAMEADITDAAVLSLILLFPYSRPGGTSTMIKLGRDDETQYVEFLESCASKMRGSRGDPVINYVFPGYIWG